jgi:hypothetical protein
MKVTKQQVVMIVALLMGGLLLVFAANRLFDMRTADDSIPKETGNVAGEQQDVDESVVQPAMDEPVEQPAIDEPVEQQTGEGPPEEKPEEDFFVANLFCSACHYDFDEEELAFNHMLGGIGCERCHGESERHRSDEDNVTPPEIMYPKAKINPTCMMCHPRHEIDHVKDHEPMLAGAETIFDPEIEATSTAGGHPVYCTECHAKLHRMNVRTIRWNKATGELLTD